MSINDDLREFKEAVRDISHKAIHLESEIDRVRCCEWVRRLSLLPNTDFENAKLRNDYIQLLRIIVRSGVLHGIFLDTPTTGNLKPLNEAVGSNIIKNIPQMSPVGPIAPFITHKSPDGRAYISIKRFPGNGILCYMAASPDGVDYIK